MPWLARPVLSQPDYHRLVVQRLKPWLRFDPSVGSGDGPDANPALGLYRRESDHPRSLVAKEHQAIKRVLATLDEKCRRRFAGRLALQVGRGSVEQLHFIRTTQTESGLRCRAYLDRKVYQTGVKITAEQKAQINLKSHRARPRWNYTIRPHSAVRKTEK